MAPDRPLSIVLAVQAGPGTCERLEPLLRKAMRAEVKELGTDVFAAEDWDFLAGMGALADGVRRRRTDRLRASRDNADLDAPPLSVGTVEPVSEITVAEAAKREGCSKAAITARVRRGALAARRDERGRYLIRADAVGDRERRATWS